MQRPRISGENTLIILEIALLTLLILEIVTKNRIEARITARALKYF
jgi:hypothetical protein